ncbi:MAG: nitroreductase family protein [Chloroflexi bacterium]|nr:nitroreductase family protein [Chloroflexota bacterium]
MIGTKKPTQLLKDEHQAVLQKLTALEKVFGRLDEKEAISAELKELTSFFKTEFWVHFTKEEEALFPEIETFLFLPRDAGPLGVMLMEHEDLRKTNDVIQKATAEYLAGSSGEATKKTLREQGSHFINVLRDHINKEDNILFMMADMHLSQQQIDKVAKLFLDIEGGHKAEGAKENPVIEALRARRSCKDFLGTPVPTEILTELVDVARYSPSGANKNTWRFIIVTERQDLNRLSEIARTCSWLASAQAAIAVIVDPASTRYWLEDCSVAAYAIWLAGEARGLGVAWAAMHQSDNSEESARRQKCVRDVLGLPEALYTPMVLGLGYRKSQPPDKKRPNLEDIIAWGKYPG